VLFGVNPMALLYNESISLFPSQNNSRLPPSGNTENAQEFFVNLYLEDDL
jgi:hypothetical protein